MITVPTTCPFCACGCGFYLLTNHDQLIGVAPGESHPVSLGKLCARGWAAHEAALWGKRLRQPLVRRNGVLEPAAWSSALKDLTSRMRDLVDRGRPVGVLGSARATNEENYLAEKLARAALGTNNVDFSYHPICRPLLEGLEDVLGECTRTVTLRDIESSEAILLIEGDLAETHPRAASSVLRALEKGAKLITLGCKKTQMARLASLHFPVTPGREGEVLSGLLAGVAGSGSNDAAPQAGDSEKFDDLLHGLETTEVTEDLRRASEWIARADRATFLIPPTPGLRHQRRRDAAAVATLAAMTGHLERPGSGLLPLLGRSNTRGACDMGVAPDRLPGYEPLSNEGARSRLHKLWGRSLPSVPGMDAETLIQSVSGLIVLADDPAAVLPMGQQAGAALGNLEFVAVLDAFVTPTVELAHVALPIASFAETEGTVTSMESRIQRLRPATEPPGEARPGWRVLAEVCAGFGLGPPYDSAAQVLHEVARAVPRYSAAGRVVDEGWGETRVSEANGLKPKPGGKAAAPKSADAPYLLAQWGTFDWGRDPLVSSSPTLSRDSRSERKLFPGGFVEISQKDADHLEVHAGRRVKLISSHGAAVLPVRPRTDLKPGVLLVPYAFRDSVANVLGGEGLTAVRVEQM